MSQSVTAKRVCELALGAIGQFPVTESAADPEHLRRAMEWLDLIQAEIAGTTRLFSLVPATLSVPITNGTSTIDVNQSLDGSLPLDRIQFPVNAWLEDQNGNRTPLSIVHRDQFDAVSRADTPGPPTMIYIDRLVAPTMRIYPTPALTDPNTYVVKLDVQTYAPNVAPGGVTGTQSQASVLTGFRQAWQLYLVNRLAKSLGSGPIIKLPKSSLDEFRNDADRAKAQLDAFENREQETTPPICESAWSFD